MIAALREGREVLPDKQLVRRPVADPNANTPKGPTAYGPDMGGDVEGPPAPIEQAPSQPEEDMSQNRCCSRTSTSPACARSTSTAAAAATRWSPRRSR